MTEYERSHTMPAPPEQVFDQAANVGQMGDWLPADLHVRAERLPAVTVHEDRTDEDTSAPAARRAGPDAHRMGDTGTGRLRRVAPGRLSIDGGTSEVTVHLSFFEGGHDPGEEQVTSALDDSLRRLERQVRLRVDHAAG